MNCPRCATTMTETEKHGVTLDFCVNCGGMWLDKGELGKIVSHMREVETSLDKEIGGTSRPSNFPPPPLIRDYGHDRHEDKYRHDDDRHHHDRGHHNDHYYGQRKKTGFQKLFDIFD
jgi:uncharacterized protein